MKSIILILTAVCFTLAITGCTIPQVIQPLRLYDLESGNTIEVILHPQSKEHGTIVSYNKQYSGEYVLNSPSPTQRSGSIDDMIVRSGAMNVPPPADMAEVYGFGKNSGAKPVGTGIIVENDSTVYQIIFYNISADGESGDGIAKDSKGRYYRIFLSTEER